MFRELIPYFVGRFLRQQHLAQIQVSGAVPLQRGGEALPVVHLRVLHADRPPERRSVGDLSPHAADASRRRQLPHLQVLKYLYENIGLLSINQHGCGFEKREKTMSITNGDGV